MSLNLVAASTQYIANTASLITAVPFTIGFWFKPAALNINQIIWSATQVASSTNYFEMGINSVAFPLIGADDGAGETQGNGDSARPVVDTWMFMLGRFISATNRRMAILYPSGVATIDHCQDITSRTPASVGAMAIGVKYVTSPILPTDGKIGEFWAANIDVQADGAQLNNEFMRALAFNGPFAFPHIEQALVDYRSLRQHPTLNSLGETHTISPLGPQTWVATGAPACGENPPSSGSGFVRPKEHRRKLI